MNCVPFKFSIEGQEFETYIFKEDFDKLQKLVTKASMKTGYERSELGRWYWYNDGDGNLERDPESAHAVDDTCYRAANYYSSEEVARNNARADRLMRQLRRFAVEHRNSKPDFNKTVYWIGYDFRSLKDLTVLWNGEDLWGKIHGIVYFDSKMTAQSAIDTFHDELIWYFTEYKDSM